MFAQYMAALTNSRILSVFQLIERQRITELAHSMNRPRAAVTQYGFIRSSMEDDGGEA
jgi:hypothetical protein